MNTPAENRRRAALDARLRGFHGVGVSDVLAVVDYLREPADTVIAGGSLTFGLGNRLSDFDVVVCGATTARSLVPLQHWVSTLRVDVWTRSHADINALFVLAAQALGRHAPIAGAFGSVEQEQQLKLLHRVAFGLGLAGAPLAPASVPDFRAVARDLVLREYAERLRESIWVAQLAARSHRWLTAVVNAREAVEEAFTVVLTACGVPFTGDKWLHERLKSHAPDLRDAYRRYASLPTGVADCAAYVADAVALVGRLTGVPTEPDQLTALVSWVGSGLSVCKTGDTWLLVAPAVGGLWELSEAELAAWRELAESAMTTIAEPAGAGVAETRVWRGGGRAETDFCLGLYERGLAQPRWDRGVPVAELAVASEVAGAVL
ncbi:hypothetical protein HC028_13275 [Planosporangium flavigriseum]|uniref:Uncharacterized protein n=1 Tax=Planosporangium flavigriseum TaxID=373681 RepID=A0A8J3LRH5_9ACTN|nr:hypothetical protein [Planosporangium flavigriseum]NJC65469.1 hypothetical protein [Planosporangium flavigriseum]GIG76687.1 hypothetical protein Pfl04_50910 [Planosporangium flavigriseum]